MNTKISCCVAVIEDRKARVCGTTVWACSSDLVYKDGPIHLEKGVCPVTCCQWCQFTMQLFIVIISAAQLYNKQPQYNVVWRLCDSYPVGYLPIFVHHAGVFLFWWEPSWQQSCTVPVRGDRNAAVLIFFPATKVGRGGGVSRSTRRSPEVRRGHSSRPDPHHFACLPTQASVSSIAIYHTHISKQHHEFNPSRILTWGLR